MVFGRQDPFLVSGKEAPWLMVEIGKGVFSSVPWGLDGTVCAGWHCLDVM